MRRIQHNSTERNWQVVGLTPENFVETRSTDTGAVRDTGERPSAYADIGYLTRSERGILRRGLTAASRDRISPRRV